MDHPNENNIPVAADAENQSAVRLAIESTPPGTPGPISRSFEQDENTREREAPGPVLMTASQVRLAREARGFRLDQVDAATARLRLEEEKKRMRDPNGIVAAAAANLANVLPKGIRDKDRELQRRLVTAGIDAGIDWQYRGYGEGDDAWSKPCSASSSRPLWFPMLEYRLCPEAVERRIAETWTDYATRGIDAEEPYCRPTETSDWLWKVLLWCFMFLAAVIGGAYAWQFFLR